MKRFAHVLVPLLVLLASGCNAERKEACTKASSVLGDCMTKANVPQIPRTPQGAEMLQAAIRENQRCAVSFGQIETNDAALKSATKALSEHYESSAGMLRNVAQIDMISEADQNKKIEEGIGSLTRSKLAPARKQLSDVCD